MPPRAFGSEPRPAPSLPAPEPSPCNPLPLPLPLPMLDPPPLPPRPVLAVPLGDMAMAPPPVELGKPTFEPGWLEITTPEPAAFPPLFAGGATDEPISRGPPAPLPFAPRPLPERALPPPIPGGGGTTSTEPGNAPSNVPPDCVERPPDEPLPEPCPSIEAGGGTTCVPIVPTPLRASDPPPAAHGGRGTGIARKSPVEELPQI